MPSLTSQQLLTGLTMMVAVASCTHDDGLTRVTSGGVVDGYRDDPTGTLVWKGIPFAAPPIGERRWRAPQDADPWHGVREAKSDPEACTQLEITPSWASLPNVVGSEDCLYLNVYRPDTGDDDLPVYFWIHGGGNVIGEASTYDLERLANKANMVAVVIQYRMNAFGYFTHPSLRAGVSPAEASGNFGTLDQIKALEWVRDNIVAFGGDPNNITIAGESAGGHNVMTLMISPLANGLFHRAVMQSGGMVSKTVATTDQIANRAIETGLVMKDRAENASDAGSVREGMSLGQLAEFLYGLSAEEVLEAHAGGPGMVAVPAGDVIEDGVVVPGELLCTIEAGAYTQVPLIVGANASESGSILPFVPDYAALLDVVQGTKALEDVLPTSEAQRLWAKGREYGSLFWRAVMVDELVQRAARHQSDVFVYSFEWGEKDVQPLPLEVIYGAAHALELPFFHGNVDAEGLSAWLVYKGFTAENRPGRERLTDAMVSYLGQFARTGNPNGSDAGLPEWVPWIDGAPKSIRFDADMNTARVEADTTVLSVAGIRRALDAEPPEVRRHVMNLLSGIQPYAVYEFGDYEYSGCR